jgi:hypothetical protein
MGRIVEGPMVASSLAGKDRASLIRISANSDDRLDILIEKFIERFGTSI